MGNYKFITDAQYTLYGSKYDTLSYITLKLLSILLINNTAVN